MKYIILLVVVGACFAFDKESMLKHNKIGKEAVGSVEVPSTCDECQSVSRREIRSSEVCWELWLISAGETILRRRERPEEARRTEDVAECALPRDRVRRRVPCVRLSS